MMLCSLNTAVLVLSVASLVLAGPMPKTSKASKHSKSSKTSKHPKSTQASKDTVTVKTTDDYKTTDPYKITDPYKTTDPSKNAGDSCTFTTAAAALSGKAKCSTIVLDNIAVEGGVTLDLTELADGTTVEFKGTTTWGYEEWSGPLFSVSGKNIAVSGAPGHLLDGNGAKWWDGKGGNGGVTKPKFFFAHKLTGTSTIKGLNIKNYPVHCFSISDSDGLTLSDVTLDNSAAGELGHNSDGFDVSKSTNIVISGAKVKNQDDCLAINSGKGITFTGGDCNGGHGLSIGSVGGRSDNFVSDITISSSKISDSSNGVRIKTIAGATGSVSGVTYKDITLSGITKYGIVVEQDYQNGSPTGTPTDGVPITGLTLSGISGTVEPDAVNIYILCAACSDWTWTDVNVTGGKKSDKCTGVPAGISC